jgi:hypothetical protein
MTVEIIKASPVKDIQFALELVRRLLDETTPAVHETRDATIDWVMILCRATVNAIQEHLSDGMLKVDGKRMKLFIKRCVVLFFLML